MRSAWAGFAVLMSMAACDEDHSRSSLLDGGGGGGACEAESAFVAAHRACATHADCVIVGSCSGGWGFRAVERSAQAEAQRLSNDTTCPAFDGPIFSAACENHVCVTRATGEACGMVRPDGGASGICPSGAALYYTSCDAGAPSCRRLCAGADDGSCGTDSVCEQTSVSVAGGLYGTTCSEDRVLTWLCR